MTAINTDHHQAWTRRDETWLEATSRVGTKNMNYSNGTIILWQPFLGLHEVHQ